MLKLDRCAKYSLLVLVSVSCSNDPGADLTVYGMRDDGTTIPIVMDLEVFDSVGQGRARRTFTYTAQTVDTGQLTWNAELTDETPGARDDAQDTATCRTTVGGKPFGKAKGSKREDLRRSRPRLP